jgi:hypothetical protein
VNRDLSRGNGTRRWDSKTEEEEEEEEVREE